MFFWIYILFIIFREVDRDKFLFNGIGLYRIRKFCLIIIIMVIYLLYKLGRIFLEGWN